MIPDTQKNNAPSPSDKPDAPSRIREWLKQTVRLFIEHKCLMLASSLSFASLFSIVPVTALLLGFSKGFGINFQTYLTKCFIGQEQVARQILSFAEKALNAEHGEIIKSICLLYLIISAVLLLLSIKNCFDSILPAPEKEKNKWRNAFLWGIKIILLVFLVLVTAPIFIGISGWVVSRFEAIPHIPGKHVLATAIRSILSAWGFFLIFYGVFTPPSGSKKAEKWCRCLLLWCFVCLLTGILFLVVPYIFIRVQMRIMNYDTIYGNFAAIPIFLCWIFISWNIVLLGAILQKTIYLELNEDKTADDGRKPEPSAQAPLSSHYRAVCALRIMKLLGDAYFNSDGKDNRAVSAETISKKLSIPRPDTIVMLNDLRSAKLVYFWIPPDTGGFNPNVLQEKDFSEYFAKIKDKYKYDPAGCTPTEVLKRLSKTGENRSAKQETSAPDAKGPADSGRQDIPGASPAHEEGTPPEAGTDSEKPDADPGVMSVEEAETILNSLWYNAAERGPGNTPLFSKKTEEETTSDNPDGDPHASDSGQKPGLVGRIRKWIRSRWSKGRIRPPSAKD